MRIYKDQTAIVNISDLQDIYDGKQSVLKGAERYITNAKKRDDWAEDPDKAPITERLRGRFEVVREAMKKVKLNLDLGNVKSLQPEIQFGMYDGTEIDYEAYLRHDHRCLGRIEMPEAENGDRTVRFVLGVGGHCGIKSQELVNRAAKLLKAVEEYESAGYGVEVFALYAAQQDNERDSTFCNVLIDCSRSSSGQIISAIGSTKIFRTLVFAMRYAVPGGHRDGGMGYSVNHSQNARYIPKLNAHIREILGTHTKIVNADANEKQIQEGLR